MSVVAALPERREAHEPPEARGLARDEVRMLVATGDGALAHARARDLAQHLRAGDVLVVNTSATLPAALPARRADGTALRLHLSTPAGSGRWVVELRRDGARFAGGRAGETLALPGGASATLLACHDCAPSLDEMLVASVIAPPRNLAGARLWLADIATGDLALLDYLAGRGAPIRYGYVEREWPLADYQTVFALHPGSAEMPSAGRPFTGALVAGLVARGIAIVPLLLHTGVSSLEAGESPYPERYAVPAATARLVNAARAAGGRVVAVGTTVVRALETVALPDGRVQPGAGWTHHVVTPQIGVRAVDGLLTGWHEPDASHLLMLEAVGGSELVADSYAAALRDGYRWHEFGDVHLILP
jgi:S-adenosylmethionine:tRNA ribosyltransferase-isomerase